MTYYDRQGKPITMQQWCALINDPTYQTVKHSRGVGKMVSTIWLGLDHGWGSGQPVIFETMVFPLNEHGEMIPEEIASDRYCTEEEALKGHEEMCLSYIRPLDLIVKKLEDDDAAVDDSDDGGPPEAAEEG